MAKIVIKHNPRTAQVLNDLEKYLDFCREFGYKFDEAHLYDMSNHIYRQYNKFTQGKHVKDNWIADAR